MPSEDRASTTHLLNRTTLEPFKVALSSALRTTDHEDPSLSERFVELRPGIVGTLEAKVNHLVTGRRGVGKSTTLAILQERARRDGSEVIFVDVETHKDRAYPDVLIEIILDILGAIRPKVSLLGTGLGLRRKTRSLMVVLEALRDAAPEVTHSTEDQASRASEFNVQLTGGVARRFLKLSGKTQRGKSSSTKNTVTSSFTRRKDEFLRDLAPPIASVLQEGAKAKGAKSLLVVLDDFYFVARETQPLVLDHLHGITNPDLAWLGRRSLAAGA